MEVLLPEFIETNLQNTNLFFQIPTGDAVENRPVRREIIETAYKTMLSNMQGENYFWNDFLGEKVYVIFRESYLKASNNAVRNWQSTYAVLRLKDVIKYAKPKDDNYKTDIVKPGFQQKNKYVELIKLWYEFKNEKLPYMNFSVEIIVGRKQNGMYVQYSLEHKKRLVNLCKSRSNRKLSFCF